METIQLTTSDWQWYIGGNPAFSAVIGNDWNNSAGSVVSRVGRFQFTAPPAGASGVNLTLHSGGKGDGLHIKLRFYIGTSATSHVNAGPDSDYTGELTPGDNWLAFTGRADILLIPNQTYYLWVFPGENAYGWYQGYRLNYTSELVTFGAAMSVIDCDDGILGSEHTLIITRYSDSLTHTISATCGSESMIIATDVRADSIQWTPPVSWAAQNTEDLTVSVTLMCTTYESGKVIGSTTQFVLFAIPEYVAPTATVSILDASGHAGKYGAFIQGRSVLTVQTAATGAYGSKITEYKIKCGDKETNGMDASFDLPNAGNILVEVTVRDSRGRIGKATTAAYVIAYAAPTVSILGRYRSDANGNQDDAGKYAAVVFKANISPIGNRNSAKYYVKYRIKGRTTWSSVEASGQARNYAPDGAVQIIPVDTDNAYEVCVEAQDDFSKVESLYRIIQVVFSIFSARRETKAVGIGQKATEPGLCAFGIPAKFNAGVIADGKTLTFAYSEAVGGYILVESE